MPERHATSPPESRPCGICDQLQEVHPQLWLVLVVDTAVVRSPHGREHVPPVSIAAGTAIWMCLACARMLAGGDFSGLAHRWTAATGQELSDRIAGQIHSENIGFLLQLSAAGRLLTAGEWHAEQSPQEGSE